MAKLTDHQSKHFTKMLLIGDSGSGKTGALASLLSDYKLLILDFDNGLDILVNIIRELPNAEALLSNVYFATLTDKLKSVNGNLVTSGPAKAFSSAMKLLTHWKTETEDLGPPSELGPDWIVVVDSLTFLSNAAFRWMEQINANPDNRSTFFEAQKRIESCLGLLYSESFQTNVIVTSHITFVDLENGITKGYPSSIGKAFSPKIPRYFNTLIEAKTKGTGASTKHVLLSRPDGVIELKNPAAPGKLPPELPLETGLATIFKTLRGES